MLFNLFVKHSISSDKILQGPVKPCKSFELRASTLYRCECIKRNGLQDRCMMWDCMATPECMTKLYPICGPGRAALLKLTDLGDVENALRKFFCADQAREAALTTYCRLAFDKANKKQILSCDSEPLCDSAARYNSNGSYPNNLVCIDSSNQFCVPSPYVLQSCNICYPCTLEEPPCLVTPFC